MFILINKPKGWTSFDVVAYVRNRVRHNTRHPEDPERGEAESKGTSGFPGIKDGVSSENNGIAASGYGRTRNDTVKKKPKAKVGHAGTLDPFATGLLIIGVGREATKRLDEFKGLPKTYVATLHLGATSDTMDATGTVVNSPPLLGEGQGVGYMAGAMRDGTNTPSSVLPLKGEGKREPTNEIETLLKTFLGKQLQTPPMFSAKQVNGQRLYKLARQGKTIERLPDEIEIYDIKLLNYTYPLLKIEVTCSTGTYIRTLANDIGLKLGVGAYCEELTRTRIGDYKLEDAKEIKDITF